MNRGSIADLMKLFATNDLDLYQVFQEKAKTL
jgi:hypothetical protein